MSSTFLEQFKCCSLFLLLKLLFCSIKGQSQISLLMVCVIWSAVSPLPHPTPIHGETLLLVYKHCYECICWLLFKLIHHHQKRRAWHVGLHECPLPSQTPVPPLSSFINTPHTRTCSPSQVGQCLP